MAPQVNPILLELSLQLPKDSKLYLSIQEAKPYDAISDQAKLDITCLENFEGQFKEGQPAQSVMEQNGYKKWLGQLEEDIDEMENNKMRLMGALKLIAELAEELAEDEDF